MTDGGPKTVKNDWTGRVLEGKYRVERLLGAGGMGPTYLARDERSDRAVVVKVPHAHFLENPKFRAGFVAAAKGLASLQHARLVPVLDASQAANPVGDPTPFVVIEHLGGGSLETRLARAQQTSSEILQWLPDVANALDFLHKKGVVHRDVKPENILFDSAGNAYVSDVAIVKAAATLGPGVPSSGEASGAPDYMAPEVVLGETIGPAYDQYALAVIVYEALAGDLPYEALDTPFRMLYRKATTDPRPLATLVPTIRDTVAAAVMRALSCESPARFASCEEFAEAFRRAATAPVRATPPGSPTSAAATPAKRPPPAELLKRARPAPPPPPPPAASPPIRVKSPPPEPREVSSPAAPPASPAEPAIVILPDPVLDAPKAERTRERPPTSAKDAGPAARPTPLPAPAPAAPPSPTPSVAAPSSPVPVEPPRPATRAERPAPPPRPAPVVDESEAEADDDGEARNSAGGVGASVARGASAGASGRGRLVPLLAIPLLLGGLAFAFRGHWLPVVLGWFESAKVPIVLEVTAPAEGAIVSTRKVPVTGHVSGPADVAVNVNGADAVVKDGTFTALEVATGDGPLKIVVTADARKSDAVSILREVVVDSAPPDLEVTEPKARTVAFTATSVDIGGIVQDAHPFEVRVGAKRVPARDGTFRLTGVPFPPEPELSIEIQAFDSGGLSSSVKTLTLRREAPPEALWRAPLNTAIDAAAHASWQSASDRLAEAVGLGAPAKEVPTALIRDVEAFRALARAEALAKDGKWAEAKAALPSPPLPAGLTESEFLLGGIRPAKVVLTSPHDGDEFDAPAEVPIAGTIEGRDGDAIVCEGKRHEVDAKRTFSFTIPLVRHGSNPIAIQVIGSDGSERCEVLHLSVKVHDLTNATIELVESKPEGLVYEPRIVISGKVRTPRPEDVVAVGETTVPILDGGFSIPVDRPASTATPIHLAVRDRGVERGAVDVPIHWFEGRLAPEFSASTIQNKPVSNETLKGSWVVLEWMSSTCPVTPGAYRATGHHMQEAQQDWKNRGVRWFGVSSAAVGTKGLAERGAWRAFSQLYNLVVEDLIVDSSHDLEKKFEVKFTRTCVVIDPTGRIVYQGPPDNFAQVRGPRPPRDDPSQPSGREQVDPSETVLLPGKTDADLRAFVDEALVLAKGAVNRRVLTQADGSRHVMSTAEARKAREATSPVPTGDVARGGEPVPPPDPKVEWGSELHKGE